MSGRGETVHYPQSVLPPIPTKLLDALDALFPQAIPDPEKSERYVWINAGERRVIEFLKAQSALQHNNILNP